MIVMAGTWKPIFEGIEKAFPLLCKGEISPEDAVEMAVCVVEDNPNEHSVGYSALTTGEGVVELDASFMEGAQRRQGGVACVRDFRNPVKIARLVMENTPHALLCGDGAMRFAEKNLCERRAMATEYSMAEYQEFLKGNRKRSGHDTVGCIALKDGHFATAMSTSGLEYRMPGRISDSAVPGCGYFCDDEIGAAVSTGVGEDIMRGAFAARAIDYLAQGESPENAARRVVADLGARVKALGNVALVVVDKMGNYGAAADHDQFVLSVAREDTGAMRIPIKGTTPRTEDL